MRAETEYSAKEVCDIVLMHHTQSFRALNGMRWTAKMSYSDSVICELTETKDDAVEAKEE